MRLGLTDWAMLAGTFANALHPASITCVLRHHTLSGALLLVEVREMLALRLRPGLPVTS